MAAVGLSAVLWRKTIRWVFDTGLLHGSSKSCVVFLSLHHAFKRFGDVVFRSTAHVPDIFCSTKGANLWKVVFVCWCNQDQGGKTV